MSLIYNRAVAHRFPGESGRYYALLLLDLDRPPKPYVNWMLVNIPHKQPQKGQFIDLYPSHLQLVFLNSDLIPIVNFTANKTKLGVQGRVNKNNDTPHNRQTGPNATHSLKS